MLILLLANRVFEVSNFKSVFMTILTRFQQFYASLDSDGLNSLSTIYSPDIVFADPLVSLQGLDKVEAYFHHLVENTTSCHCVIDQSFSNDNHHAVNWTMTFVHPKLNGNNPIKVKGMSKLETKGDRIIYHHDYFDLGAMVYQHIPLIGGLIRCVNRRLDQ